jgi:hypothetical protein
MKRDIGKIMKDNVDIIYDENICFDINEIIPILANTLEKINDIACLSIYGTTENDKRDDITEYNRKRIEIVLGHIISNYYNAALRLIKKRNKKMTVNVAMVSIIKPTLMLLDVLESILGRRSYILIMRDELNDALISLKPNVKYDHIVIHSKYDLRV